MTVEHAQLTSNDLLVKSISSSPSPSPWDVLGRVLQFQHGDHKRWWDILAPVFGISMASIGYKLDVQYRHLLVLYDAVIPNMGPFPNANASNITWTSPFPPGPLEASVNYQSGGSSMFRFTIEPVGPHAGTPADPVNELAAKQLMQRLGQLQPGGVDSTMFDHFYPLLCVDGPEARRQWDSIAHIYHKCHTVTALDMQRSAACTLKTYFPPLLRSTIMNTSMVEIIFDAVESFHKQSGLCFDYTKIKEFMSDGKTHETMMVGRSYLSFDCLDPAKSRIKVYTEAKVKTLEEVYSFWSLGGRLKGPEIDNGFKIVSQMWDAIYSNELPGGKQRENNHIQINWEMSAKDSSVAPKLYFTVIEDYDAYVSRAIVDLFKGFGWAEHVQTHKKIEKEAYPMCDANPQSTHTYVWISIAYKKTGPYITVYTNPGASILEKA
ncbi:hypothetical protein N7527_008647 [Penicillium freii]|nr:hypothetical protein N7527_008647 [Penicillium freii]